MSKPASSGAKSLEEILASIRKSLAEEPAERPSPPVAGPAKAAQTEVKPAKAATPDSGAGPNGAAFSNRLAAALNGPSSAPAGEEDLSDLLSTEPTRRAAVTPATPAKPAEATPANGKDPLWFLSRLSGAAGGASGAAARARDAAKSATPSAPVEEVKLSRPEELRATLPPLFGSGEAAAASAPTAEPSPVTAKAGEQWQLRTEPRIPRPSDKGSAAFAPAKQETPPIEAEAPRESAAPTESLSSLPDEPVPSEPLLGPVLVSEPPPSEASPVEAARALSSTAVGMPTTLPTRALEQVVAELLEPVIQQWLQSNLPRLIEKVVREEAAKAVAVAREPKKV